jgi:DNA polymerase-3 subunit epsilon
VPIVVLDTETTGLYPGLGHRIVEIGAVRLENWQVVAEVNQLIQPKRKMDVGASAINGIYDEDLVNQPTFLDIANNLLALLDGALLVAHNATFDAGFLGMELFINGYAEENDKPGPVLPNPWLCTLQLARRYFYFGQNNLAYIANRLGVRMGRAHRALNDVYMTAEVLKRMVYELSKQRLETVGDLLYAQGEPIYTPPPPRVFLPSLIANALANSRQLRILYLGKSGETERVISPYYATQHQGVPYLIAFCHLAREQRTFRLDRIFGAEEI